MEGVPEMKLQSVKCCVFDINVKRICTDDSNLIIIMPGYWSEMTNFVSPNFDYLSFTVR